VCLITQVHRRHQNSEQRTVVHFKGLKVILVRLIVLKWQEWAGEGDEVGASGLYDCQDSLLEKVCEDEDLGGKLDAEKDS